MKQQRAPLPERRVNCQMNPFEHVGINYARPFKVKAILKIALPSQDSTCLEKISRRSYPTDGTKEEKVHQTAKLAQTRCRHETEKTYLRPIHRLIPIVLE